MVFFSVNCTYELYGWPLTSIIHLQTIILRIFRQKSWFGLAANYKRKWVRKTILGNLETWIFTNFSPMQTVVVPPGETNISKLLTPLFIFIRVPLLKSSFGGPDSLLVNSGRILSISIFTSLWWKWIFFYLDFFLDLLLRHIYSNKIMTINATLR